MKLFANLFVVFSLLLGQFNTPSPRPYSAVHPADLATATETPTPAATETLTPEPTSTTTSTPVVTVTPQPTDTETQTPEVTPPPAEPQIALTMYSTPGFVTPGESLTINWAIEGISPTAHTLFLSAILPEGFTLTDSTLNYDETTRTLTIPITQESGQFDLHADQPAEDALMPVSLMEAGVILAQFSLPLPTHEQFIVDENGGQVVAEDGDVTITIPEEVLPEDTTISVGTPVGENAPIQSLSGNPIEITATTISEGIELHQFDQPITLEIQYNELNIPEEKLGNLFIYWYNPDTGDWEAMASNIDNQNQTISTETTHFSTFDIGINDWQAARMPTVDAFQVSQFTGAASYSYPIELPAGPGGFKPSLSLSYSSQVADQSTLHTQAGWVGMGWSLDSGYIERNTNGTDEETNDDSYMISVNGVSSRLDKLGVGSDYYHTMDENFWRIYRNPTTDTWTVWDKQGNVYSFTEPTKIVYYKLENNQKHSYYLTSRWMLTSMKNIFDKEIAYTYTTETKTLDSKTSVTAVYPNTINYANGRYQVKFVLSQPGDRKDYPLAAVSDDAHHEFYRSRLQELRVLQDANGDGTFETIIRSYHLGYAPNNDDNAIFPGQTFSAGARRSTLTSIEEFGQGNTSALSATSFTYDGLHLTHAENGYGGSVDYTYQLVYSPVAAPYHTNATIAPCQSWYQYSGSGGMDCTATSLNVAVASAASNAYDSGQTRPGGAYKLVANAEKIDEASPVPFALKFGLNYGYGPQYSNDQFTTVGSHSSIIILPTNALAAQPLLRSDGQAKIRSFKYEFLTSFYRVTQKVVSDGNGHTYTYGYAYSGEAVNDDTHSEEVCPDNPPPYSTCHAYTPKYSELRGHRSVTETAPDGKKTVTLFFQDDARKGKPESVTVQDSTGKIMSMTLYVYSVNQTCNSSYYVDLNCYWVYTDTEEHRTYNNDGATYTYTLIDNTYNLTYGNLTSVAESSSAGVYRTTTTDYFPYTDGNKYLVGLPARQQVKNASGAVISETLNIYDTNSVYNAAPSVGKLAATRTWVTGSYYSQTSFGYDSWGNQTSVTSYSGFGTASVAPSTGARTTYTCMGGGGTLGGTACADDGYHTYALWTKNPLNQTTSITYDYTKGLPLTETDPNGAQTRAEYDGFGRITSVFRPDPVSGSPVSSASLVMSYQSTNPFITSITQNVDGSSYFTISRVYDGMGRQVKNITYPGQAATVVQITGNTVPGGIYTDTDYQTYLATTSTVTLQSAPHLSSETARYTTTTSNLNARTSTVTAPDGTSTVTFTNGLTSTMTDPRGNVTTSVKDVWGNTLSVTPPTGPMVSYTYDTSGNLLTATRGGGTTTLTYNQAGQKTAMSDPDMGNWTYNYDALGNMTSQVDARSCTLNMNYDNLSRMTDKSSSGTGCNTQVSATYTYDAGTNGIGRRTSTLSNGINNSWTYDKRGRVLTETVQDGTAYTTSYTYNLADMPLTMTYPSNSETVTYGYDAYKRLSTLSGAANYVSSSTYDSSSRLTDRTLGNGLTQKFTYNPWTTQGGRLDKIVTGSGTWNGSSFTNTLQNLDYAYDFSGNITQIYDAVHTETQAFTYDTLDRLTNAQASGDTAGAYNETYAYDSSTGNLVTKGNTVVSPNPGTNSMAAWWSLNETSGQRSDSYGTSHLSVSGTVGYAAGKKGNAASFSSTTPGVLTRVDNPQISTGDIDFTLVAHFYPTSSSGVSVLVNKGNMANSNVRDYALIQSSTVLIFAVGNGSTNASVSTSFGAINTWHTVVAWHDSANDKIYIQIDNGTPVSANYSGGVIDSTYPLSVGGHVNSTYVFNGRIDEVTLYKRILTASERSWIYNSGTGRTYSEVNPTATHTYGDASHKHAVTALTNGNTFGYDANGNMTSRHVLEGTEYQNYILNYDAENRLVEVKKNNVVVASFTFDADGKRVKSVMDGETILFVGTHYEVTNPGSGQTVTKYYLAGTTRVAMRKYTIPQNMLVEYLLSDHLNSTSLTTDVNGAKVLELRYKAWGEVRASWTANPTTTPAYKSPAYTFTGQYSYMDDPTTSGTTEGFGLMFYNARWYDPALGRFAQADTMIPQAQGTQAWDRYAYVTNSPVRYNDPSGHVRVEDPGSQNGCSDSKYCEHGQPKPPKKDDKQDDQIQCSDGLALSVCYELNETEMDYFYDDLGALNKFSLITSLGTIALDVVALLAGGTVISAASVALFAMYFGASAAAATAFIAAAPVIVLGTLIIGAALALSSNEMGDIQSNMFHSGAGETGGTVTITNYLVVNKYTVTTEKGSFDSWGSTSITPLFIGADMASRGVGIQ